MSELVMPDFGGPFGLQLPQTGVDRLADLPAPRAQIDETLTAFRRSAALQIAQRLELADQVVGGLPGHPHGAREIGRPDAIGKRIGEDGEMGVLKIGDARVSNGLPHAAALPGEPKECPDEGRLGKSGPREANFSVLVS